ncbi:MAG: hypothetical protein LBU40_00470 [Methanobrevibacter sp.]|jgi:replication-associated recombination protein RarA|nr:hypothetical protein [Methanobrevibacter sp.]
MDLTDKTSPFQPQGPVDPENFEGRKEIIEKYSPYLNQSAHGIPQHFFIFGKRGMGKTSLAGYFKDYSERRNKMMGVHIVNDAVHDVNSLVQQIIEKILNEVQKQSWSNKLIDKVKKHVSGVTVDAGVFGVKIEFNPILMNLNILKIIFLFI